MLRPGTEIQNEMVNQPLDTYLGTRERCHNSPLPRCILMRLNESVLHRRFLLGAFVLLISTAMGCGGGKGTVTGKVTVDGKPLPAGKIAFIPKSGSGVGGEIKDGQYKVEKVPPGTVNVTVETQSLRTRIDSLTVAAQQFSQTQAPPPGVKMPENARESLEQEKKDAAEKAQELKELKAKYRPVPEKYGKAETSGLTLEVKSGSNSFDVPLSAK